MGLEISVPCLYLGDGDMEIHRGKEVRPRSSCFISVRSRTGTHECLISGWVLFPARPITRKERGEGMERQTEGEKERMRICLKVNSALIVLFWKLFSRFEIFP